MALFPDAFDALSSLQQTLDCIQGQQLAHIRSKRRRQLSADERVPEGR